MISYRAAATAIILTFIAGLLGSLALRPPNEPARATNTSTSPTHHALTWRVPVAFQTTMPGVGENPRWVTNRLAQITGDAVNLKIFEPGEIVPAFGITDAVRDGKVEAGYTWLGYDQGKIAASTLLAAVPFGMEPPEFIAWWFNAGGQELAQALYRDYHLHPILCGITGPETAGWFRFRIKSLEDLRGLKIRFAGIGGKVIERLGASVTMIPGGEIYQALEKGAIDASEFSLPMVDQSLGFSRVAPYNYFPGWHQPATASHLVVNLDVWHALPKTTQAQIETACTAGVTRNLADTEAAQGEIIANFPNIGVSAETLPIDILRALAETAAAVLAEEASKDASFQRILASQKHFRTNYAHWKKLAYLPRDF